MAYETTLARVEQYFDSTATRTWEALTSDVPVSGIRATVRAGRDAMREKLLGALPADLTGARVLDAGCGAGQMCIALAERGAEVTGIDISPQLLAVAESRIPAALASRITLRAGDMLRLDAGCFDAVVAMDSLIYYDAADLRRAVRGLSERAPQVLFTVAPRTRLLMAMFYAGKAFPRSNRSPVMTPHEPARLIRDLGAVDLGRVSSGFYISHALECRR